MKTLNVEQRKSLERATTIYQDQLVNSMEALSYLNGRGIDSYVAETYRLGYVDRPEPEHIDFAGMISIPYVKVTGIVGIKFRRLDEVKPRYLATPGCGVHFYNTNALMRPGRFIGVCEGEIDAITLEANCKIPAVAVPGVTQWKAHPEWARLLDGRQVLIFPDVDTKEGPDGKLPGEKLANAISDDLQSARIVRLPAPGPGEPKMDVNLCYLRYGADEIRKRAGL